MVGYFIQLFAASRMKVSFRMATCTFEDVLSAMSESLSQTRQERPIGVSRKFLAFTERGLAPD
jgi:hypothetical protein